MDSPIRQTSTASPAKPGELSCWFRAENRSDDNPYSELLFKDAQLNASLSGPFLRAFGRGTRLGLSIRQLVQHRVPTQRGAGP